MRATAADREMASAIGINVPGSFPGVFVVGAMLAALGGAIGTPVRVAAPGIGAAMIIQAFIITVIGGLGNLKGAFVSSIIVGVLSAPTARSISRCSSCSSSSSSWRSCCSCGPQGLFAR